MAKVKTKTRREKAVKKIVENRGNVSKSMREAGYSEAYASNPQQFVATKSLQELLEEKFPPEKLAKIYTKLLNKKETATFQGGIYKGTQPHSDVARTLDMINKLQGNYAPEKVQVLDKFDTMSDEELAMRKKELEEQLYLAGEIEKKKQKEAAKKQKKKKK